MATEQQVREGLRVCRQYASAFGRRGARTHKDTLFENMLRTRALEGICGDCPNLQIEIYKGHIYMEVTLRCLTGESILNMQRKTDLGQTPVCPSKPAILV